MNQEEKRRELDEALEALWDEIIEESHDLQVALARLRQAGKGSAEHDRYWGQTAAALFDLKLKAADSYKLMERLEALEEQAAKV